MSCHRLLIIIKKCIFGLKKMNKTLASLKTCAHNLISTMSTNRHLMMHFIDALLLTIITTGLFGSEEIGLICPIILGVMIEFYEMHQKSTRFNPMHLAADCAGALTGNILFLSCDLLFS